MGAGRKDLLLKPKIIPKPVRRGHLRSSPASRTKAGQNVAMLFTWALALLAALFVRLPFSFVEARGRCDY